MTKVISYTLLELHICSRNVTKDTLAGKEKIFLKLIC